MRHENFTLDVTHCFGIIDDHGLSGDDQITPEQFEKPIMKSKYKKLLFGLAFYNALVLERRKFGGLGWNLRYAWQQSDVEAGVAFLRTLTSDGRLLLPAGQQELDAVPRCALAFARCQPQMPLSPRPPRLLCCLQWM